MTSESNSENQQSLFEVSESEAITTQAGRLRLSISQLAAEFGCTRETITRRLNDAGAQPVGLRNGYDLYSLRSAIVAYNAALTVQSDPSRMQPFQRRAHFQAEHERIRVNQSRGNLLEREAVSLEWARVLQLISHHLELLIDELERDAVAGVEQLQYIETKIDAIRESMYQHIVYKKNQVEAATTETEVQNHD